MRRIIFSLLSVVMLIGVALPAANPVVAASGCSINIQTDPKTGAYVYIYDDIADDWLVNGTMQEPLGISVTCHNQYTVWVEKGGHTYRVKNAHGWSVNPEGDKAYGEVEGATQNLHFHGDPEDIVANNPPIADADGPYEACIGEPITFNGTGSYDPDPEDTLEYRWDFDSDGTYDTSWSSSPYETYTWHTPYSGIVTLEVRDLFEGVVLETTDTDTATVTVLEHGPATSLDVDPDAATIVRGQTQTYTAAASDDYSNTWDVTSVTSFSSPAGSFVNNVLTGETVGPDQNVTGSYESLTDTVIVTVVAAPSPITYGGGGSGGCYLKIDMLGERTIVKITCTDSKTTKSCTATDPDNIHFLEIERGTRVLSVNRAPKVIVMSLAEESPPAPEGMAFVGPTYNFTGYTRDTKPYNSKYACASVTFDQPITLVLNYNSDELPETTSSLALTYYDNAQGSWVELSPATGRVAEVGKATGLVNHFSQFAILAKLAPPAPPTPLPAHFVASGLSIVPSVREVWKPITFITRIGESVTITANVANDGGQEDTYIVELKINGETQDTKEVTLAPEQSQQINFTLSGANYGQYDVEVAGLRGKLTVSRIINWWLIIGIIGAISLIAWGVIRNRRKKKVTQSAT